MNIQVILKFQEWRRAKHQPVAPDIDFREYEQFKDATKKVAKVTKNTKITDEEFDSLVAKMMEEHR